MRRRLSEMRKNGAEKKGNYRLESFENKKSKTPENQSSTIPPLVSYLLFSDFSLVFKSPT